MISSNQKDKFDFFETSQLQQPNLNLEKESQSWDGREVGFLSAAWNGLCNIITQIFDKIIAFFYCCRPEKQSIEFSENADDRTLRELIKLDVQGETKQTHLIDEVKLIEKTDSGIVRDELTISESSESDSESYSAIHSESSSNQGDKYIGQDVEPTVYQCVQKKSGVNELPKVFINLKAGISSVVVLPVGDDKDSTKINETAKVILQEKKINQSNIFVDHNTLISQKPFPIGSNLENDQSQSRPFESPADHEKKNVSSKGETKSKPSSDLSNDSSAVFSKKSGKTYLEKTDFNAKEIIINTFQGISELIKNGSTPENCADSFFVALEEAAYVLSEEDKLKLICFLISNPDQIKIAISEAIRPKQNLQPLCNKAEIQAQKLAKIYEKKIEKQIERFFGTEYTVFISGQVSFVNLESVQKIVTCIRDSGKYDIAKEIEIISSLMTKFYLRLKEILYDQTAGISSSYLLESYIEVLETMESEFGGKIQAQVLNSDQLGISVVYANESEEDEESYSVSIADEELDFADIENYHESAMHFLKAHAARLKLIEFSPDINEQKSFRLMLSDILKLLNGINPSSEMYQVMQKSCREICGAYILKDPKVSSLDFIEKEYSQLADKLNLLNFQDLRELLGSGAFAQQQKALKSLHAYDVEKDEIRLFAALMKMVNASLEDLNASHPLYTQLCVAFRKIPGLYISNYKQLQNVEFKEIANFYDSLATKLGHKTSQQLDQTVNAESHDSQKKYEVLALLKTLSLETELTIFEEKLTQTESSIGEITDSHFLYKFLESAFAAILNKYIDILMTRNSLACDPGAMKKIKTAYDALAKKLNFPSCPDSEVLLSPDFADKYVGLQRLQEYSESKMEVQSFAELLNDASDFIKQIDSKHPLFMPLTKVFDAIILRFYDSEAGNSLKLVEVKASYRRLAKILGHKEVELIVDTTEAQKEDSGISNYDNLESLKNLRKDVREQLNNLEFDLDCTSTRAMAMVWKEYLKNLLLMLPRETAIGMLLVTFEKELGIIILRNVWEESMSLDEYLSAFSEVGNMQIQNIRIKPENFLNIFVNAGLSTVEAEELLFEITS